MVDWLLFILITEALILRASDFVYSNLIHVKTVAVFMLLRRKNVNIIKIQFWTLPDCFSIPFVDSTLFMLHIIDLIHYLCLCRRAVGLVFARRNGLEHASNLRHKLTQWCGMSYEHIQFHTLPSLITNRNSNQLTTCSRKEDNDWTSPRHFHDLLNLW